MAYVEEKEFVVRLAFRCEFPDDYDGDDDGLVWAAALQPITNDVVRAAMTALARHPELRVRHGNRGRPLDEELTLVVERAATNDTKPHK